MLFCAKARFTTSCSLARSVSSFFLPGGSPLFLVPARLPLRSSHPPRGVLRVAWGLGTPAGGSSPRVQPFSVFFLFSPPAPPSCTSGPPLGERMWLRCQPRHRVDGGPASGARVPPALPASPSAGGVAGGVAALHPGCGLSPVSLLLFCAVAASLVPPRGIGCCCVPRGHRVAVCSWALFFPQGCYPEDPQQPRLRYPSACAARRRSFSGTSVSRYN